MINVAGLTTKDNTLVGESYYICVFHEVIYIVSDDFAATWSLVVPKCGFHVVQSKMPVKVCTTPVSGDLLSPCQYKSRRYSIHLLHSVSKIVKTALKHDLSNSTPAIPIQFLPPAPRIPLDHFRYPQLSRPICALSFGQCCSSQAKISISVPNSSETDG